MYHKKNVDYAWEDFVYQVENKNVKRSNEMYYPHFTKVIVNFFMTKDSLIPRRNKVNWHFDRDEYMFTTIKVVSRHEDTQLYGAILPDELTNEAIKDSESYKEYYVIASGVEPQKPKASVKKKQTGPDKTKTPPNTKGKRLKTSAKAAKPAKKKQTAKTSKAKGLTVLFEVALTEAEQMKLATKRSLIQTHSSHASGSGADERTGGKAGVPDVPTYRSDDEQISWKSSEEEDDDEVGKNDDDDDDNDDDADNQDDDDNDGDDFVHPKFSTHDEEDIQEEGLDLRVHTPSHYESINDEDSDEEIQGVDVEDEEMDEEDTNEEEEVDELYRDVNINLEGRDTKMTDAPCTIIQTTQVIEDTHVIITQVNPEGQQQSSSVSSGFVSNMLNPSPDTGIDSIFNLNTESTSLVDISVTTIAKSPLLSATTLPPPPIPLIPHPQQTPIPTPATVPSSSLQDLPNFGSLFGFEYRLKTLETNFSKFKQTNQFAAAVSLIPGIVDVYLANKMHEAIKIAVQLQSDRLVTPRKFQPPTFLNLSGKDVLIDKMESNKSIHRSDEQKNLYKALVDAYESDKLILDTYGDTVSFKRRRDDEDKDEEPSAGSNRGSKRRRAGKEPESTSAPKEKTSKTTGKSTEGSKSHHKSADKSAQAEEPMHTAKDLEEPAHQEFVTGDTEDKPDEETSQHPDWFQKPAKPPTPDRDWNKTLPAAHGDLVQLGQQYPHDLRKPLPLIPNSRGRQVIPFDHFINNDLAYLSGGVSSQTYTTSVTKTKAADYGHIKWIKDLVPNRMWSQVPNKDKKNRLMCIDELHKFSDGALNDVRTALGDCLKGIRMKYLPQTIWIQNDKDKAGVMIQAIDKQLKTRRIMRSLENFFGGRPYEGDFRLPQRTI
ncbi:hypothetical protein Tco_0268756 [Tanacetum coccineum]